MGDSTVPEEVEKALAILADGAVNHPDEVGVMPGRWLDQDVYVLAVERNLADDDHRVYPVAIMLTADQWNQVQPPAGLGELVDDSEAVSTGNHPQGGFFASADGKVGRGETKADALADLARKRGA